MSVNPTPFEFGSGYWLQSSANGGQKLYVGVFDAGTLAICTVDGDNISKVGSIDNVEDASALVEHLQLMLDMAISGRNLPVRKSIS